MIKHPLINYVITTRFLQNSQGDMANPLQAEGLCLRFPENLPPHANFTHEAAVQMLLRAVGLATQVPFHPSYIDKPPGTATSESPAQA